MVKRRCVKVACLAVIVLMLQLFQPLLLVSASDATPPRDFLENRKGDVQSAPEPEINKPSIPADLFIKKPPEENPYRAGVALDRSVGIFTKNLIIRQENPEEIILPVMVVNMAQAKSAKLLSIKVIESSAIIRARLDNLNVPIASIAGIAKSPEEVLSILGSNDRLKKKEILEQGFFKPISLNFKGSQIKVGDSVALTTKADILIGGEQTELATQTTITIASVPPVPSGWYLGDAHLHSDFSPDTWLPAFISVLWRL